MRRVFILAILSLFFVACSGGGGGSSSGSAEFSSEPAGTTPRQIVFQVQIPPGLNSELRAQAQGIDQVNLAVLGAGGVAIRTAQATVAPSQSSVSLSVNALPVGGYTVRVDGLSGGQVIATDSKPAVIVANAPTTVNLLLTPVISNPDLVVTPSTFELTVGATNTTQQLSANRTGVNWTSSDPALASVDSNGLVTLTAPTNSPGGSLIITATDPVSGDTATSAGTVIPRALTVTPNPFQVQASGGSITLTASRSGVTFSDATATGAGNGSITVDAMGVVTGNTVGPVNVQVTDPITSESITVPGEVIGASDLRIEIDSNVGAGAFPLVAGHPVQNSLQLQAFRGTTQLTSGVNWTIQGGAQFASINANSGLLTSTALGVSGVGDIAIQAEEAGDTADLNGTVEELTDFFVQPALGCGVVGQSAPSFETFRALADVSDGTVRDMTTFSTWSSERTAIATVGSTNGQVTPVADGQTLISVEFTPNDGGPSSPFDAEAEFRVSAPTDPTQQIRRISSGPLYVGTPISAASDYFPDVAFSGDRVMIVKENSLTSEAHAEAQRFRAILGGNGLADNRLELDPGDFPCLFPVSPSFFDGREPAVAMRDNTFEVAVAYRQGNQAVGRLFEYDFNPAPEEPPENLGSGNSLRNPSIALNSPSAPTESVVVASFARVISGVADILSSYNLGGGAVSGDVVTPRNRPSDRSDVAMGANQDLNVLTWVNEGPAGTPGDILFRLFEGTTEIASGTVASGEGFGEVSAAMFDDGRFVVVYDQQTPLGNRAIFARTFSQAGVALTAAPTSVANTTFTGINNEVPDVAADNPGNNFIVAWQQREDFSGAIEDRIMVAKFSMADPTAIGTTPFEVSSADAQDHSPNGANADDGVGTFMPPAIDTNSTGDFVVVWASRFSFPGPGSVQPPSPLPQQTIYGRLFGAGDSLL